MGQRRWQKKPHTNWACRFARSAEQGRLGPFSRRLSPQRRGRARRGASCQLTLSTDTTPLPPAPGYRPPGGGAWGVRVTNAAVEGPHRLWPRCRRFHARRLAGMRRVAPGSEAKGRRARPSGRNTPHDADIYSYQHPPWVHLHLAYHEGEGSRAGGTYATLDLPGGPPGPGAQRPKQKNAPAPPCVPDDRLRASPPVHARRQLARRPGGFSFPRCPGAHHARSAPVNWHQRLAPREAGWPRRVYVYGLPPRRAQVRAPRQLASAPTTALTDP